MWDYLVGNKIRCLLLFICAITILVSNKTYAVDKNEQKSSTIDSASRKSSGPYCGLYCLYAAMKLSDKEIDFRELVKPLTHLNIPYRGKTDPDFWSQEQSLRDLQSQYDTFWLDFSLENLTSTVYISRNL